MELNKSEYTVMSTPPATQSAALLFRPPVSALRQQATKTGKAAHLASIYAARPGPHNVPVMSLRLVPSVNSAAVCAPSARIGGDKQQASFERTLEKPDKQIFRQVRITKREQIEHNFVGTRKPKRNEDPASAKQKRRANTDAKKLPGNCSGSTTSNSVMSRPHESQKGRSSGSELKGLYQRIKLTIEQFKKREELLVKENRKLKDEVQRLRAESRGVSEHT